MQEYLDWVLQKSSEFRKRLAFGLALGSTLIIYGIYASMYGLLGPDVPSLVFTPSEVKKGMSVVNDDFAPFKFISESYKTTSEDVSGRFDQLSGSVSSVLVPFFSNIDVYEKP